MEETPTTRNKRDPDIAGVILLVVVVGLLGVSLERYGSETVEIVLLEEVLAPDPFAEIELEAASVYVWDVNRQEVLFEQHAERQWPLASLTKIMTALVAEEIAPSDSVVAIEKDSILIEGDSGLEEGDAWSLADLLGFTLLVSSNDGAHAVAAALDAIGTDDASMKPTSFVERMNRKASELGLVQTYFINETGLDANPFVGGGYGSARDMAALFTHAISVFPELIEVTAYEKIVYQPRSDEDALIAENTNEIVGRIPGVIGSKTGFTDLAGGNLVIAYDAGLNHPIVISVLGSSTEGRFNDVEKIVSASLRAVGR